MRRNLSALMLLVSIVVLPAAVAATMVVTPVVTPENALFLSGPHPTSHSSNWAGYAVISSTNKVTYVQGSWVQPTLTCTSANRWSSFWVGIDGDGSNTVEQTGTEADCSSGTAVYSAWYEFYPAFPFNFPITVHPGDTMKASVKYVSSTVGFTVTLTDVTTGVSSHHSKKVPTAKHHSAEWIAEAPSSSSVLPLSDFGTAHFGKDKTNVANTNEATIGGTTHVIGGFASSTIQRINMTTTLHTKAATSALTPDGTSFNVTWMHAT
ncbi:MAG TPA: G1 family glutamic endopeptidase [Thermoplasmata archaeon]|nr:G1 family glutamic endopeptidase [Thermoplasmata archaeon]